MATAKKSTKKQPVKRAPAKAAATTKVTRKVSAAPEMKSFRRAVASPFFTFRITKQTLYWSIIGAAVLALGVWVLSISIQVNDLYDQIDSQNNTLNIVK